MVSAVILNYLDPALTAKSVEHLAAAADEIDIAVEIIVVDNSAPETAEELKHVLPDDTKLIENGENRGFAAANNQGLMEARGDVILIMNNDLFINKEVLETGVKYIINHEEVGIWAPKLTDQAGNPQHSCARFLTLKALIAEYLLKFPYHTLMAKDAVNASKPMKVDTVIGACMFIPKMILQELGGFDEDYFFTAEDIDLCLQAKKRGYEVIFDPRCSAVHLVGASQNTGWYDDPHLHKARMLYFKKNHNFIAAGMAQCVIKTGILMRKMKHKMFR